MAPAIVSFVTILFLPAYELRFSLAGIRFNALDLILLAASIFLLLSNRGAKPTNPLPKRVMVPALVLTFAAAVSVAFAPDSSSALGILKSWFILPTVFAYAIWREEIPLKNLRAALTASGAIAATYAIFHFYLTDAWVDYEGVKRAVGFFSQPNYLALFIAPILTLAIAGLRENTGKLQRSFTVAAILSMVVAVILSYSRAGILTVAICIPLIALFQYGWKQLTLSLGIGAMLFAAAYASIPSFQKRFVSILDTKSQTTSRTRVEITQASLNMLEAHPLTGIGLGGYQDAYSTYRIPNALEQEVLHPHNVYLAFWTQTGILGLLAFITLAATAFLKKLRSSSGEVRAAALAGVSILLIGFFDTAYWKNDLSLVFWILVAMTSFKARSSRG